MKHILIIDDNASIYEMLYELLESEGYRVTCKTTGRDALSHIITADPDLIILDVFLDSGYDGRDICRIVKQHAALGHIPIVMFSANHQIEDIISKSCTPQAFISKPFDLFNLVGIVAGQLENTA